MSYTVRDCTKATRINPLPYEKALKSYTYPDLKHKKFSRADSLSRFRNYIGLYEYEDVPKLDNRTFFNSLFGENYTHIVVVTQLTEELGEKSLVAWIVFEATNESDARQGIQSIHEAISPLLVDGTVTLSETLLDVAIVPNPVPRDELITMVQELIETKSSAHPEWALVVQALLGTRSLHVSVDEPDSDTALKTGGKQNKILNKKKSVLVKRISERQLENEPEVVDLHTAAMENNADSIRKLIMRQASRKFINSSTGSMDEEAKIGSAGSLSIENSLTTSFSAMASVPEDDEIFYDVDSIGAESHVTPLYVSVQKGYVKSSMFFLLGGANPNFIHPVSGNTCLHLAAQQGSFRMIKLLLTFDAELSIKNVEGKTPCDLLCADSKEYDQILQMLDELQQLKRKYKELPQDPVERSKEDEGQYLLSFDGGGSRCVSQAQILLAIEKRMKELNPKCKSFISHFDYVAGTSGGAFHTFVLVYNRASLKDDRALTINGSLANEPPTMSMKTKNIESLIKSTLGTVRVMADVVSPRVITTATLANTIPPKLHLMTNYGEARDNKPGPKERKIWEAARISSAAPTYFYSFENCIDGGIMANNPTVDAIVEMNEEWMKKNGTTVKLSCVLSMGTGVADPISVQNIDVGSEGSYGIKGLVQKVDGYKNLISLIISQVTRAEGQDILRAKTYSDMSGGSYFRLSAPVGKLISLDTADPVELIEPMFDSFMYCYRNPKLIDKVARKLLSNPRIY